MTRTFQIDENVKCLDLIAPFLTSCWAKMAWIDLGTPDGTALLVLRTLADNLEAPPPLSGCTAQQWHNIVPDEAIDP